ncbi:hypothetical protein L873DRAFT_1785642 [Choiromyces venosus 120613-1]|uniref:Uncharacterized protein n=1 Tax=Choiromyces venosus 120613-1 TaxID=1336337 RepID=A0A3N4KHV2_9PEZI|nr:hypothetical protein L873DRAFT_1785642 [Choiromyces venosus 120613-1]
MKHGILELAFQRLRRKIKSLRKAEGMRNLGLQLDWNLQLYTFIKLQLKAEEQWKKAELKRRLIELITCQKSWKELALLVANSSSWGTWVMHRILKQEIAYIQYGKLLVRKQGNQMKLVSWLADDGIMLVMREHMSCAGEGITLITATYIF